jgi:hypothetical protein
VSLHRVYSSVWEGYLVIQSESDVIIVWVIDEDVRRYPESYTLQIFFFIF